MRPVAHMVDNMMGETHLSVTYPSTGALGKPSPVLMQQETVVVQPTSMFREEEGWHHRV